ncbi:serine/threonine protein kinase [Streptacidiphilus sp. MAP12-16]|uniref:protein kinase domain-containing protein n=1 Tax=Streptacidiphilus sp. MAP12-16 TaxID=3156300 RepID=UPI003519BF63
MNGRIIAERYELATLVGQGGMGQVWTAFDRHLHRRVAVKLLRPDRTARPEDSDELRRRFARESRVTAQVDHPGLVTVHDAGGDGDDLYLVMQYVDGADLADHLAEHDPYPWPWAVAVAAQLCSVLAAVHAVPVVHRDLKPRNLMVRPDGTLVVLDLGVAAVLDSDTTRLTRSGAPIGTPAYMAPEQAMGGAVGPRTDLYALGVVLHELLSGTVPFAGASALGVLHRHLYEPPVPLRQVRPEVPEPLEALVLRLLAKDPWHRPTDAQEVYRALAPLLPVPAAALPGGATGPMDPTRPFLRPYAPWPDRQASNGPPPTGQPPTGQEPTSPPPTAQAQPAPRPAAPRPAAARSTSVAAAVDEVKRLLDAGRLTQAVGVLGDVLPAATAEHGPHSPVVGMLRKQYAATLMEDGQFRAALPELRRLAEDRAAEAGPTDLQVLRFRFEAAQCLEQLGETVPALAEYRALLPYVEQQAAADPALPLEVRHRTGQLLLRAGDRTGAREVLQRLLFDAERLHGPQHPLAAEARRALEWLRRVHA